IIQGKLNDLGYQYKYDHRNRLVEKRMPGKDWEYIVYDKLDRPVLTQDANLRAANKWLFTKYDALGRVVYTGKFHSGSTRPVMQSLFEDDLPLNMYEDVSTSTITIEGTNLKYTNRSYPTDVNNLQVYTINYYDTYTDLLAGLTSTVTTSYGKTTTTNTKGLATISKVRVLGTNNWITTVTYYDEKARPIYVYSKNDELQTTDIVETKLDDFTGRVLETKTTHKKTGKADIVTVDKFFYDNLDRLTKQTQTIGSNTEVIAENSYDELGQLVEKKVGGKITQSRLQTVDYKYNVRGWLKNINQDADNDNDLFNFILKYNDIADANKRLYNGNISEINWNTLSVNNTSNTVSNKYVYTYDALNRITRADDDTGRYDVYGIVYDKNGNIINLRRDGHTNVEATSFGVMDNLVYSYDNGNKLTKVLDNGNDTYGFKDGANTTTEYTYDVNGNMKTDANKGITNIVYNHLNLPTQVTIGGQNIIYTYDAAGMKLKKVVNGTTTEYAGNYMYENNVLQFFNHSEGYVKVGNVTSSAVEMSYVYQYKDHLGNVRLSYTDSNNDGIITPSTEIIEESNYYPFGLKHKGYSGNVSSLGNSVAQKFGYNGKELNEELGIQWHDFGARNYDATLGRWMNLDAKAELYFNSTPYSYVRNSPVMRIDPNGDWDITVHVANSRKKNGFGIAVLTNRHGEEVFRFKVRVEGIGGRNRMKTSADTPLGTYDIPNKNMWITASDSGLKRKAYGPNDRLILTPKSGEIKKSGRSLIRVHGGRQEFYNKKTGKWQKVSNPKLKKTEGCIRCYDSDILTLKTLIDQLMGDDPDEYGGVLKVIDDLDAFNSGEDEIKAIFDQLVKGNVSPFLWNFTDNMDLSRLRSQAEDIYAARKAFWKKVSDDFDNRYKEYLNREE
ncbi:RHS repeat-associated core domain-containing protein, partial [Tenacibaculum sp. Cn5-1]